MRRQPNPFGRFKPNGNGTTHTPGVGKAPEHLTYLGAECATLNDAMRTGPARGLRWTALSDLHNEYRTKCAEEDSEARQKVSHDNTDLRNARRSEQMAKNFQRERSALERDQCHELLRILHGKRQRLAEMNAGRRADFERSEVSYRGRCAPR